MKDSEIIRWTDKHVGTFICRLFNFLNIFGYKRETGPIINVLIIELFEMGAAIMAYSSLKYLKEHLDGVNIYCLSTEKVQEPWKLLNIIPTQNVLSINDKNCLPL